jgi:hypothetical protein
VNEIKDRIDIVHTPDFVNFTNHIFPVLREIILSRVSPQMEDNEENKIRHTVLEICSRFPTTETLRTIVMDLMNISLRVLQEDNEDNAIIALKIMFDLHKTYRPSLESQVQPLMEIVLSIYKNMPTSVRNLVSEQVNQFYVMQSSYMSYNPAGLPNFPAIQNQQQYLLSGGQGSVPLIGMFPPGSSAGGMDSQQLPTLVPGSMQLPMSLQAPSTSPLPPFPTNLSHGSAVISGFPVSAPAASSDTTASPRGTGDSGADKQEKVSSPRQDKTTESSVAETKQPAAKGQSSPRAGTASGSTTPGQTAPYSGVSGQSPYLLSQMGSQPAQGPLNSQSTDTIASSQPATNPNAMMPSQHSAFPGQMFQPLGPQANQLPGAPFMSMPLLSVPMPMNMNVSGIPGSYPPQGAQTGRVMLVPATQSLKVLAECPHVLMFLFQVYFKTLQKTLSTLMEHVMNFIEVAPSFGPAVVSPGSKALQKDLIFSQVKSLTLVNFMYRIAPDVMSQYEGMSVNCVRSLLNRCPDDVISTRKDMIHATKALMTSELKKHFFAFIDEILDEKFFLGPAKHHVLRPFALSAIIDFVHQVKDMLEIKHIIRVVHVFSMAMNDMSLDIGLHTSCCKLLFYMVDTASSFQVSCESLVISIHCIIDVMALL